MIYMASNGAGNATIDGFLTGLPNMRRQSGATRGRRCGNPLRDAAENPCNLSDYC
jgi:hypothetical protein